MTRGYFTAGLIGRLCWQAGLIALIAGLTAIAPAPRSQLIAAAPLSPMDLSEPPTGEVWVQNMVEIKPTTAISARFFDASESWDFTPVLLDPPPRSMDLLRVGKVAGSLPSGQYAAHIGPTTPFPSAAIGRNEWPATGAAVIYGARPAEVAVTLPWVVRRRGAALASSRVSIQNARSDRAVDVSIRITGAGADPTTLSLSRSIPAGASAEVDLARDADVAALPDGFAGTMHVQAATNGRIAATVTTELEASDQAVYAAAGAPDGELAGHLFAPRVTRRHTESRDDGSSATTDSFIAVANGGPAVADVTVTYRGTDEAGNACAGQTIVHGGTSFPVPAGGTVLFVQGDLDDDAAVGASGLPDNCLATAEIQADGARLAATVVEVENGLRRAGATPALVPDDTKRVVYVPLFRKGYDDLSTSVQVMNAGDETTLAQLEVVVIVDDRTVTVNRSASLAPGMAAGWAAGSLSEIPAGALGVAKITSGKMGVPLVAVGRETSDNGTKDNALYPAFAEPPKIDNPAPIPDEYQPYFLPSVWHSTVYDLGLIATGTSEDEIKRVSTALNTQAFNFAKRTGLTIAVSVQPYMFGKVPYHDWLADQVARGFPDVGFQARSWLVSLNYNGVMVLGSDGLLEPLDSGIFPGQGDFLDEAWGLNFLPPESRPLAIPWLRGGCTPNYVNLAQMAAAKNTDQGFELMQYLVRPEQQRENYRPQSPALGQLGYPTLKALYTELDIRCPAAPTVLRTDPERVTEVVDDAVADAAQLAAAFDALDVEVFGDGANAAKAVGIAGSDRLVVTQPMINHIPADELDRRLRSAAGVVVGTLSLRRGPTPSPTATGVASTTPSPTATSVATVSPTPTETSLATPSPTTGSGGTATATPTTATGTPTPTSATTTLTPTAATATPTSTTATGTSTPATASATPGTETPFAIFMPYLARGAEGAAGLAPQGDRRHSRPAAQANRPRQGTAEEAAYVITWRRQGDGSIQTVLLADDGTTEVDPDSLGITLEPVDPEAPRSPEPEAFVLRGSIVVCLNVDQHQGCLHIDD